MKPVVVIDPGHGGADNGCSSGHLYEKDIVLDVAKRIQSAAEVLKVPFTVELTRTEDINLTLRQAGEISKQLKADLVVALHVDALSSRPSAKGMQVFYCSSEPFQTKEADDRRIARVLMSYAPKRLQGRGTVAATDLPDAGDDWLRRVRNVLLPHRHATAVLVEAGFITNQCDRDYLESDDGRGELALCLLYGIKEALNAR